MRSIFASPYRKAFLATVASAVLVTAALNVGSTTYGGLFAAWSGTLAGFACAMLALAMFVHGMRRGMRAKPPATAPAPRRIGSRAITSAS
nr:hypothetical protein [Pannonibacter phragmitetus]